MGMCSRSLAHAQTLGAAALLAADGRLRHMTPYNANKTNKTGRDIPPGAYRQLQAAERTYRPRQAREAASRWCGDALPRPGPAADPACPPPRRTYHPDHTGTWCPSRRQPLPIPFVLAVSLARVYRHHPAAHGGPSGPHGTASYARQASAREECHSK